MGKVTRILINWLQELMLTRQIMIPLLPHLQVTVILKLHLLLKKRLVCLILTPHFTLVSLLYFLLFNNTFMLALCACRTNQCKRG